jgi:hypothetical protein
MLPIGKDEEKMFVAMDVANSVKYKFYVTKLRLSDAIPFKPHGMIACLFS